MTAKMALTKLLTFAVIGTLPLLLALKSPVFAATPIGYFDGLHNDQCYIDGWTLDPDEPNTSVPVHVYRDGPAGSGTLVAAFTADVPRSDVNDVTGYPGNHAFAVNLDSSTGFRDGQPHQIYVYGINTDGSHQNTLLANSPKTANCSVVAQPAGSISANPNPCTIPSGGTTCTSSIVATVANADSADICVSPAGGSDQLFAGIGAGSHTKDAPWISNASYTFKLRVPSGNCSGAVIAAVNVTGVPAGVGGPGPGPGPGPGQGQNQGQNQSQNNQQTTNVNVSNTNTNTNTINLAAALKDKEKAKVPTKQPETGLSMGATLAMLSGAPLGLWLRRFGRGAAIDTSEESMSEIGMSLVSRRASKLG